MKQVLNFLAKLSLCLLILIAIEGIATLGQVFIIESYNWLGFLVQGCFIILCIRASVEDWE